MPSVNKRIKKIFKTKRFRIKPHQIKKNEKIAKSKLDEIVEN